jgi:TPR repeat protein
MKMKWCAMGFLMLLLNPGIHLRAQEADADRRIIESVRTDVEKGDSHAQCALAEIYRDGAYGVTKDPTEAAIWFHKSAQQGVAEAQCWLGFMYSHGDGVEKNDEEAVKWYRKAAEQGDAIAQNNLGNAYHTGDGVTKDMSEAAKWWRKAAEQNLAPAQSCLGACYEHGGGVEQNYVEAVKWYRKAADQNNAIAQNNLGGCYAKGYGVTKNDVEAVKWFCKGAEQGCDSAQYNLGLMNAKGNGVLKNYVEADKWFNLASAQGNEDAKKFLSIVEQNMTPGQIAEAQKLAREFKPRKETTDSNSDKPNSFVNPTATGSGFFITDDGYLISNYHVVKDAVKVRVVTSVGLIEAKVVRVDAANDLALLKAVGKFSPLPVTASRGVKLGGTVATVGFPNICMQGFSPKLAKGEIASLSGAGDDARYFQISVPVQPGNSGGALVDEHGNVVGVVSAKLDASAALAASGALPENVNYAVKSSFLLSFLESVPAVSAKLKEPITADRKFEDVVKSAQDAAVLVLVY